MEIETKQKHSITKEQIVEIVEDILSKKIFDPILSCKGLRWTLEEEKILDERPLIE